MLQHQRYMMDVRVYLTGPAFSHLIANLVLHEVDQKMQSHLPERYFRYVDDVILVGTEEEVTQYRTLLSDYLGELELELHDGVKDFVVTSADWLQGEYDFEDKSGSSSWMTFIGSLKKYLVITSSSEQINHLLLDNGFRMPIPEYVADIQERNYLSRLISYSRSKWVKYQIRKVNINSILNEAKLLRDKYEKQLAINIEKLNGLTGYERKRVIPKLRYAAGRMVFLGLEEQLNYYSSALKSINETRLLGEVFDAVARRDVSRLLEFGANAVQSAAQVLRLKDENVICAPASWGESELQGLAILKLNSISLDIQGLQVEAENDLLRFSDNAPIEVALMKSENAFVAEVASLHGCEGEIRHESILSSTFDPSEEMAFDAINQLHPSSY